ncbi:MAG TPA: hypothetical protein VI959_00910, partial [Alphaproteobacteria bacterium]|nr:hypothetical protein [Alphaproteobacteria bacterium]
EEVPDQAQSQAPLKQKTYEMFERDGKNHSITGFCGEFDLQKATLMGDNFTLESPKGYTLGRLIRDQNRDVFATFFSHANCSGSHNLGGDIALSKYDLLGKAYTGVYDGRHLLILPYLIRNGSSLNFLNKGHFKGPLNHYCELETEELILEKKSTCIASKTTTRSLKIGDVVNLTMATGGTGTWSYYTYNGSRIGNSTPSWCFSNSEPAEFTVNGSTSGSGSIDNIASVFYSNAIEPGFKYSQQDFKSPLFQQVIGDTSHTRESLKQAKHREIGCGGEPDYPSNVTRPTNSYGSNGCSVYGVGFLVATNNFAGAQQIFKASNSSPHQKLQNASGGLVSLEGNTTTPTLILIKKPETTLAIGSKGAQTVTFESPRSDFGTSTQTLNTNLFKINDLSRFLQPSNPTSLFGSAQSPQSPLNPDPTTPTFIPEDIFTINRYYFKVTSRYEHTTLQDQEFYNQVEPFLVIEKNQDADTVTYEKPPVAGLRFFAHQPNQLLKWVQEETQKKLKRGHLYPYESMDLEVVKKLHKNGFDFLLKNETSTALVDPTTFKERLSDPILFYQEAEENGVVLYTPVLYFPPKWILESALGLNTQQLLILSSEMSIREMANTIMQHNPKLLDGFVKSIQSSPEMMLQLEQEEKPLSASDVNIDRSEPWQVEGEDLLFNEYYTSALNNECGFKSLGFGDKAQTISFLKEALSISKGTNLYDELFSLIVTELKTDQQRDPIFKRFSNTPEGIEKYLDYILTTPYMLNFEQHLQGLTPYGLLDALALILNKNVKIYEPTHEGSKKLVLTHTFIANPSLPTVFQNMIYRGLHFNTAVETTLKAQNTQALQREADFLNELKMSLTSPLSNTSQAQQSLGSVIFQGQNKADTGIIFTEGDVINHGSLYGVDWFVRSSSNILLESLKRRLGDSCNYREEVYSQASMEMSKTLTLIALGKIVMHGAKTFSGELTSLYALSGLLDMPLDLLEQQMYSWYNDDEEGTTTIKKLRKHQSHHSGNGSFKSFSGGGTDLVSSL